MHKASAEFPRKILADAETLASPACMSLVTCTRHIVQDVYKTAEAIRALGYEVTKEPGPLPGLGTKITATVDPDGWKVRVLLADAATIQIHVFQQLSCGRCKGVQSPASSHSSCLQLRHRIEGSYFCYCELLL